MAGSAISVATAAASAAGSPGGTSSPVWPCRTAAEGVVAVSQQYELVRELGRGMFGEVWLARKKPSGIEKAIKIAKPLEGQDAFVVAWRRLDSFRREASFRTWLLTLPTR